MTKNKTPRGIRNNNPGNIRFANINWQGLATPPSDGEFCIFTEPKFGIRALAKLLRNYNRFYGIRTIKRIIARYAPSTENNTAAYIAAVCRAMECDDSTQLDMENDAVMLALIKAIIKHENGQQPYTDEELQEGITC